MSESKHTLDLSIKGPDEDGLYMVVANSDLDSGAKVFTAAYCTEADARLYAAAPDLLAALQFIRDGYADQDVNHVDFRVRAFEVAADAIAKAEGRDA